MTLLWKLLATNKGHVAAYLIVLAMGVAGYTDLLLEIGELRATDTYSSYIIQDLTDEIAKCEEGPSHH